MTGTTPATSPTSPTRAVLGYKVWRLREGTTVDAVHRLVRELVAPHYARLSPHVRLRLEVLDGGAEDQACVLAVQEWATREVRAAAFSGPVFDGWWQAYLPVLSRWQEMVELVAEWETERVE